MAPAKRKATTSPAPPRKSARLSKNTKMTTAKPDAEEVMQQATTRAPRIQVPHACKERLDELTRLLDFKTVGSTVDFFLPTTHGAKGIAELTRDLGYHNAGETIDWLLEIARNKQSLELQNADRQLNVLLEQARAGVHNTHTHIHHPASHGNITGYPGKYSSSPSRTPQFSQNPQGVTPSTFTSTGGLGGSSTARYYSNPYTPIPSNPYTSIPTSTPVQSNTRPVQVHRSDLPISNTYFNEYPGGTRDQAQMKGDDQFLRGYMSSNNMHKSARMNMQGFPHPQSQIRTYQGKLQHAPENFQLHNRVGIRLQLGGQAGDNRSACTGNIVGPGVGVGVSTPIINPKQYSVNSHPNRNVTSVHYGDGRLRMDQVQAPPHMNQLIFQGSTSLQELGGTCKAQNRSTAMQLPVQNSGTASSNANHIRSWIPNRNPAQDISKQVQAPADHNPMESRMEGHDPTDLRRTQSNSETHMAELPLMKNKKLKRNGAGERKRSKRLLNGGQSLAGFNETQPHQEDENPAQHSGNPMNEFVNTEIETQIEKQEVKEFANVGIVEWNINDAHPHQEDENPAQHSGNTINEFVNIEIETQTEKQEVDGFANAGIAKWSINEAHPHQEDEHPAQQSGNPINEFSNIEIETQTEKQVEVDEFANAGLAEWNINEAHPHQEDENPAQHSGNPMNEFWNIEIETQTEKQVEVDEFANAGIAEWNINEAHPHQEYENPAQHSGNPMNEFWNIEIETQTEKQVEADEFANARIAEWNINEAHPHQEDENPAQHSGNPMNEFSNIEIETQTEKQVEVDEFANAVIAEWNINEAHPNQEDEDPAQHSGNPMNEFSNIEIETQAEKQELNEFVNVGIVQWNINEGHSHQEDEDPAQHSGNPMNEFENNEIETQAEKQEVN